MKPLKRIQLITTMIIVGILFVFSTGIYKSNAYAGIWAFLNPLDGIKEKLEQICTPTKATFAAIAKDQKEQSIVRFSYNYEQANKEHLVYEVMGISRENIAGCMIDKFEPLQTACEIVTGRETPANCDKFFNNGMAGSASNYPDGLLGLAYMGQNMMNNTRPPLSLAYYFNKQTEKMPFFGKALAVTPDEYPAMYLDEIFIAWEFIRDMSYAFLAIIMLVIGIMIASKRKVNAQAVVTIQYAIPRLIIAIILVTFSYPIGATITNLSSKASGAVPILLFNHIKGTIDEKITTTDTDLTDFIAIDPTGGVQIIIGAIIGILLLISGVGGALLGGIMVLIIIVLLAIVILVVVKYFITYLKMIFSIMMAPLIFTISAIPGNDDKLENWFKQMFAYMLSLIALTSMFVLSFGLGLMVVVGEVTDGNIPIGGIVTQGFTIVAFMIGGLLLTLQAPKKIQEAIMGAPKRK